jgi:hypothetical protein
VFRVQSVFHDCYHDFWLNTLSNAPAQTHTHTHTSHADVMTRTGQLWELDGRRRGPIPHGPTKPDTLLADAVEVVKQQIARIPSVNFSLVALAPTLAD